MKKAFLLLCTLLLVLGCALPLAAYHLTRAVLGLPFPRSAFRFRHRRALLPPRKSPLPTPVTRTGS